MNQPASKLDQLRDLCVDFTHQLSELELRKIVRECENVLGENGGRPSHPDPVAIVFMTKGLAFLRLGKFEDAASAFRNAAHHEPENPAHRSNLVAALVELGRVSEAIEESELSLRKFGFDSTNDVFWFNYAEALYLGGRVEDAVVTLAKGLAACEWKVPMAVFNAAKAAASIDADHEAAIIFARYLALRLEKKLGSTDPIAFIEAAPEDFKRPLAFPENRLLARAIRRVTPLVVGEDEDNSGAHAVLEDWADLRQAANSPLIFSHRPLATASRPPSLRSCGASSPTKVGSGRSSDRASAGRARTSNGLGPKINRLLTLMSSQPPSKSLLARKEFVNKMKPGAVFRVIDSAIAFPANMGRVPKEHRWAIIVQAEDLCRQSSPCTVLVVPCSSSCKGTSADIEFPKGTIPFTKDVVWAFTSLVQPILKGALDEYMGDLDPNTLQDVQDKLARLIPIGRPRLPPGAIPPE